MCFSLKVSGYKATDLLFTTDGERKFTILKMQKRFGLGLFKMRHISVLMGSISIRFVMKTRTDLI